MLETEKVTWRESLQAGYALGVCTHVTLLPLVLSAYCPLMLLSAYCLLMLLSACCPLLLLSACCKLMLFSRLTSNQRQMIW